MGRMMVKIATFRLPPLSNVPVEGSAICLMSENYNGAYTRNKSFYYTCMLSRTAVLTTVRQCDCDRQTKYATRAARLYTDSS